jgi:hypothetical protein|tara:strand:+ start:181 stop:615 length:435 start_codon:yes stop_codon:yes gene_type:complete
MSSTNIDYQIIHYQGDTYTLEFNYLDDTKTPVNLAGASAEMNIRRAPNYDKLVAFINDSYPNGSFGMSGDAGFTYGFGHTGETGGILLNHNGVTGAVYVRIDNRTISNIPAKRNFYDLTITFNDTGEVKTILKGTFELARETTR